MPRLRLINPAASTVFRVVLEGHKLTVTHADGNAVVPVEVDALDIGMGERYDVQFTANNPGRWRLIAASPEDASARVSTVVRYIGSSATLSSADALPAAWKSGRLLRYSDLSAATPGIAVSSKPDQVLDIKLGGSMAPYNWTLNGQAFPQADELTILRGQTIQVRMRNDTAMRHPMHLHGHFFRLLGSGGGTVAAPLKDTVLVNPRETVAIEFTADNPGKWFFHCHHAYHMAAGMARVVAYQTA